MPIKLFIFSKYVSNFFINDSSSVGYANLPRGPQNLHIYNLFHYNSLYNNFLEELALFKLCKFS